MRLSFQSPYLRDTPLPPVIRSNERGTWAFDTMTRRVPRDIATRILSDNAASMPSSAATALEELFTSVASGREGVLSDISDGAEDNDTWNALLHSLSHSERNWLDAPWLIAEYYFYRRVVAAFRFHETRYDMFAAQKRAGLVDAVQHLASIASSLRDIDNSKENSKNNNSEEEREAKTSYLLQLALFTSLWGNKMDLSLWPKTDTHAHTQAHSHSHTQSHTTKDASHDTTTTHNTPPETRAGHIASIHSFDDMRSFILDDHSPSVIEYLLHVKESTEENDRLFDIIVDNAGFELVSDFILGHILLCTGVASKVRFRTKAYPTFVSDATTPDCLETIAFLKETAVQTNTQDLLALATRFEEYTTTGAFQFLQDCFYCEPIPFWDMPERVERELRSSKMVFVKGDANYRRLVGDRQWPLDTPASDVLSYWPATVCALRTLKAELGCGISKPQQDFAASKDKQWLTSGKWGVIQSFVPNNES